MATPRAPSLAPAAIAPLPTTPEERSKRDAGRRAVDDHVRAGMAVGVGSGSTIVYAVQRLAERAWGDEALAVRCVPTSFQSRQLLVAAGLSVTDLDAAPELDVAIDGADDVDPALNLIKGGGGCHTQEKIVASAARVFVVIADFRKRSPALLRGAWRRGVPVEIVPSALPTVTRAVRALGGEPRLRAGAPGKAGPTVTDNGGFILDCDWEGGLPRAPADMHAAIKLIPGVVETGIFAGMASACYFGCEDGSVEVVVHAPGRE